MVYLLVLKQRLNSLKMKQTHCSGTPRDIGLEHGKTAKVEVGRSLKFYADLFLRTAGLSWAQVCDVAMRFDEMLRESWPEYCEEMRGEHINTPLKTL